MALRPSVAICLVLAAAVLARAGDGDAPAPSKPADAVSFGPPPDGLRLEIKAPTSAYWPGEAIRPEVALVNEARDAIPVVLPKYGSEAGAREPLLSWSAAYVDSGGKETPVELDPQARCGTGMDFVWQDDVTALKAGGREALEHLEDPSATLDLQAPGKVRLRLRYAYSAGRTTRAPAAANVAKDTGDMGAQEPFEMIGAVDVTVERPLDVVVEAARAIRVGAETKLADALRVRAVGRDATARTLAATRWCVQIEFDAPADLGLDTTKCWERRPLARDATIEAGATAALSLDASTTCKAAREGTCRVRAVLHALDPGGGGPRIVSAWTDVRIVK